MKKFDVENIIDRRIVKAIIEYKRYHLLIKIKGTLVVYIRYHSIIDMSDNEEERKIIIITKDSSFFIEYI
jgi:hypothetical protein